MARVYLETYGCTLNQADSDILRALIAEEHQLVDSEKDADVVVINTCTVKGATENKTLSRIETIGRKLVVTGCMGVNQEKIRRFAPKAPIVGTSSLSSINMAIGDALSGRVSTYRQNESKDALPKMLAAPIMRIPINDGCLSACAFCQTKIARPYLRSYSPKTIIRWINQSVSQGAREIQLTSMDSGAYGRDIRTNLAELLELISKDDSQHKADEEFLVRLGMINPDHAKAMLSDLIRLMKGPRFYKFIHVPVQSGSEKVCREMNRDHSVRDFVDIVSAIRSEIPDAMVSTDIIVGYPTETEDDYQKTLELLRQTRPDITNVSKFSPRPGTKAKELKQLPSEIIKRRSKETSEVVRSINLGNRRALIGKRYRVLVTESQPDFKARNINYQQVVLKIFGGNLGDFANVKITDANHGSLFGELE
jgi:threonylcarbamoyladenosine tRNA methylthiotransferase CDKAL1